MSLAFKGLGLTNYTKRVIKPGNEYNSFFTPETGKVVLLKSNGDTYDTINFMVEYVKKYNNQCADIAKHLNDSSLITTLQNIEWWQMQHFKYREDGLDVGRIGAEEIHTPNRQWAKRHIGIDCDDFSIMASCILTQLQIPHYLRKADYGRGWQHVYVIIPLEDFNADKRHTYYCLDPVMDGLNNEKKYFKKYDTAMEIYGLQGVKAKRGTKKTKYLKGLGNDSTPNFLQDVFTGSDILSLTPGLKGLGTISSDEERELLTGVYNNMVKTYNAIAINSAGVDDTSVKLYDDEQERQAWLNMYAKAIDAFWTSDREKVLAENAEETERLFNAGIIKSLTNDSGEAIPSAEIATETGAFNDVIDAAITQSLNGLRNTDDINLSDESGLTDEQLERLRKISAAATLQPLYEKDMKGFQDWYKREFERLHKFANGCNSDGSKCNILTRSGKSRDQFISQRASFEKQTTDRLKVVLDNYKDSELFTQDNFNSLKTDLVNQIYQQLIWQNALKTVWNALTDLIKKIVQKIGDVVVAALKIVHRYNPLIIAARQAVLIALRMNWRGITSILALGKINFITTRPDLKEKYDGCKRIYTKVLAGDEKQFDAAIDEGGKKEPASIYGTSKIYEEIFSKANINEKKAYLSLGVVVTATTITAGLGVLTTMITLVSKIRNGEAVPDAAKEAARTYCADKSSAFYREDICKELEPYIKKTEVKKEEVKTEPAKTESIKVDNKPDKKDNTMLYIGGGLGLAALIGIFLVSKNKNKGKSLGSNKVVFTV